MVPEHAVMLIVAENVDMACNIVERAAMDRAVADVDEGFAAAYASRRRHREVSRFPNNTAPALMERVLPLATSGTTLLGY